MRYLFVTVMAISSLCSSVHAQAPHSLSFQGFLTDSLGLPINNPGVSITFKLYDGLSEIWSETQPSVEVEEHERYPINRSGVHLPGSQSGSGY